jgi:hypothetical protein
VKKEIYECDECATQKKETNNWWVVLLGTAFTILPFTQPFMVPTEDVGVYHICGHTCLLKVLSRWLSEKQGGTT